MRLSLLALIPAAVAFLDTAPLYVSGDIGKFGHIAQSHDVKQKLGELIEAACQKDIRTNIWRVNAPFDHKLLDATTSASSLLDNVQYDSIKDVELAVPEACIGSKQHLITIKDVDDPQDIGLEDHSGLHIVQGVPQFKRASLEQIKAFIDEKLHHKRETEQLNDESEEHLQEEIQQEIEDAEAFVQAEGNDDFIESLEEAEGQVVQALKASENNSLFNTYAFFSPGLFMCLIVSFLLIGVLSIAMSWITSLEITYKAFDKQVDYEKKTE